MVKTEKKDNRAKEQAKAQFDSIKEMLDNLQKAEETDNEENREEALEAIEQDALSAEKEVHYNILLCWGGPAVRIHGTLDEHNEPETAELQYQDWFTGWTEYPCDEEVLLEYARHYYFAE